MSNNSIFVNVIKGLDLTVGERKVSGKIHDIRWQDMIKLSHLIRQGIEAIYPGIQLELKEFLGDANNQNVAGVEIILKSNQFNLDDINKTIAYLISSVKKSRGDNLDLFTNYKDQLSDSTVEKVMPVIQNFVESNPNKIALPINVATETLSIMVAGDYKKVKSDKVYLEHIEKIGQIDMLGRFTTKFTLTNPKDKTLTIFFDPKDFSELHDLQGKNEIAAFELQPIQDNGKTDYMLKSIKRISQTLDVF